MLSLHRLVSITLVLCFGFIFPYSVSGSGYRADGPVRDVSETFRPETDPSSAATAALAFKWNLGDKALPLLGLPDQLRPGIDQALGYPIDQFNFPIFQSLNYDDEHGRYILPVRDDTGIRFIDFQPTGLPGKYATTDASNMQLSDNDSLKTIRTSDDSRYVFVRYPDGEFRCANIKRPGGSYLSLIYTANGLLLHGVVDSSGRTVTFNYDREGIRSITQTWMADSTGITKTWSVREVVESLAAIGSGSNSPLVAFAVRKALPNNALVREYSAEMAASDRMLATVFGGPTAVAAANGFEPSGLAAQYPLYRGDVIANDGRELKGHLSYAMHLYGNSNGTGDSPLYVPSGFVSHSNQPSPTDAVVTFYYPRLGNLTDVTLAVFHVADFQISSEGERVRIGNIGGPGGSSALYKHTHIEFYRGNVGLPTLSERQHLRIDPSSVFACQVCANSSKQAHLRRNAAATN